MSADVAEALRLALVNDPTVAGALTAYQGSLPIFTRRPAPTDAPYPMILVSPDVTHADEDGVSDKRPVITRDIAVYGQNDTAPHYRTVESLAYRVRDLFHRMRQSIAVSGWNVVSIMATGPIPAPSDDDRTIGRMVTLTIRLSQL
jgi:hypothetical protein